MTHTLTTSALIGLFSAGSAMADPVFRGGEYGHMWGGGYGFVGFGMMFLFWAVVIVLAVLAARWLMANDGGGLTQSKPSPLDVLQERLAKGEIDIEDYEARRKALEG